MCGLDAKIVALYAKGLSTREITTHLEELYGVEVSATLISNVTDVVSDEIKTWQSRPLESIYAFMDLDCLHLKIRDDGVVRTKAVYLAIDVNLEGIKDVLGIWKSAQRRREVLAGDPDRVEEPRRARRVRHAHACNARRLRGWTQRFSRGD
jgi:transposase-like protein